MVRHLLLSTVLLGGCTIIGPHYSAPETAETAPPAFEEGATYSSDEPIASWWLAFEDAELDALVSMALAENNDLGSAIANVNAARAQVGLARLDRLPFDTISTAYTRQRQSASVLAAGFGDDFPIGDGPLSTNDIFSLSMTANWEIDLWGRVSRSINIAKADLEAAQADLFDLQTVVIAETVDAYVSFRGAQAQLAVARANYANQLETLNLVVARRDAGRGTDLDVENQAAQTATTEANIPSLEAQVASDRYRLGVLVGVTPDEISALTNERAPLPMVMAAIPVGDVASLLRRRPDIQAAERRLASATETIGLNMVSAFPTIALTGTVGVQSLEFNEPFAEEALNFSYGPTISWSLTDLLRFEERVNAAEAGAEAAFDSYEQAVLSALAETETALANQRATQQQLISFAEAARASTKASELARLRFDKGASDFFEVLDAERRELDATNQLAASRTSAARAQVAVFRALRAGPGLLVSEDNEARAQRRGESDEG